MYLLYIFRTNKDENYNDLCDMDENIERYQINCIYLSEYKKKL